MLVLQSALTLAISIATALDAMSMIVLPSFVLPVLLAGLVVISWLLAACGDVEENPGPPTNAGIEGEDVSMTLGSMSCHVMSCTFG